MSVKIFAVPFDRRRKEFQDKAVREFLRGRKLVTKSDYLFEVDGTHYIALVVRYRNELPLPAESDKPLRQFPESSTESTESPCTNRQPERNKSSVETPEMRDLERIRKLEEALDGLNERQRAVFEMMRKWRADRAREKTVPAWRICSNREMADLIRANPRTPQQIEDQNLIAAYKVREHGRELFVALSKAMHAVGPVR